MLTFLNFWFVSPEEKKCKILQYIGKELNEVRHCLHVFLDSLGIPVILNISLEQDCSGMLSLAIFKDIRLPLLTWYYRQSLKPQNGLNKINALEMHP